MQYLWSSSTGGFYVSEIHNDIPADAVEITPELHQSLLADNANGMIIQAGADGQPVAVPAPEPTSEQKASAIRAKRNNLLASTDWWAVQDRTMTQAEKDYRQALRDITDQPTFPDSVVWPTEV